MKTCLHLALLAASSALLLGQTAPAPSPLEALPAKSAKPKPAATGADKKSSADSADAVVELNVFEVKPENDEYRAAHTTSGTRYNMPIHDLPMQVGVLTEQFLRDVGAADIIQAIEYMGGVQFNSDFPNAYTGAPEYGSGSGQFVQIRGMQTEALTRNNFARIFNIDAVSIGRIDTISGPGGGLYGAKAMGGAVNTLTSIPQARPSYFFRQYAGDHDYFRSEAKLSGPLLRNGRVRHSLAMSQTHNRTPNMYDWYDRWVFDATLSFQLTRKTDLRLQHEYQHQERSALRFSSGGNGNAAVFQDTATVTPGGEPYGVTIYGRESLGPMLAVPDAKRFRFDGPDTHHNLNFRASTVLLTHSFTPDLVLRLSYNREDRRENRRSYAINIRRDTDSTVAPAYRNDPAFRALLRPGFIGNTPVNQVLEYSQNRYVPNSFLTRPAWRAEGYYGFQTGPVRHAVTAGVTSEHYTFGTGPGMNYVAQSTNDPGVGNATAAILNTQTREQFLARYRALDDFTSVKRWDYSVPTVWSPTHNTSHFFDRTIYFNHNGEFFRGRLLTMFGILDVRSDRKGLVYNTSDGSLNRVSFTRQFPTEGRKPMFNATFKVTPSLSIYGNTSKSFSPEYSPRDGNLIPFQGSTAVNREVGLKWELFERKILFSTAWFTNTRKDWPTTVPWIYNNDPEDNDSLPGFGNASILRDYEARGYEARVDYRILPNWTINGSYTHNPAKNTAVGQMVAPTREGFNIFNGVPVPVPDPAVFLLGTNGTNQSINLFRGFTRYDVRTGPLKGLWTYFGAKYDGHRSTLTTTANVTAATLSAPNIIVTNRRVQPRLIYDLNVGFRHRVGKYKLNYQVNIANLLDYQDWYAGYWNAPRTVRFATDLSF